MINSPYIKINKDPAHRPCEPGLWRRRRDSNPRYGLIHTTPLAGEPLEPLGYFSKTRMIISKRRPVVKDLRNKKSAAGLFDLQNQETAV